MPAGTWSSNWKNPFASVCTTHGVRPRETCTWAIGVPWEDAAQVGNFIGQKTILNEFVGYTAFGPEIPNLDPQSVLITTFALAGSSACPARCK